MESSNKMYEAECVVSTFAGTGQEGHYDSTKCEAQFNLPTSIAVDQHGDMYVADCFNHRLRKINALNYKVHTVAGTGEPGFKDGPGDEARFYSPYGIAVHTNGDIIVTEVSANRIRAFSPSTNTVRVIVGHEAGLWNPLGVAVSTDDSILVCDGGHHRIARIHWDGSLVDTIAGDGHVGYVDGEIRKARFNLPSGVAVDSMGDIYVADRNNHCIRKIHGRTKMVSTVAGSGIKGWRDGNASTALLNEPADVVIGADGCVYISEVNNCSIRKLDPVDGRVTTVAGTGEHGFCSGEGHVAQLNKPYGLAMGRDGMLYVVDGTNHSIRAISCAAVELESELKDVEKELEEQIHRKTKLAQDVRHATKSTIDVKNKLAQTKNATIHAEKKLVDMQKDLKAKGLYVRAVLTQRKAELQMLNKEVSDLESTHAERVTELTIAKAELNEAQTALRMVTTEHDKYAQRITLVNEQLRRTKLKNAVEDGVGVVGKERGNGSDATQTEDVCNTAEAKTEKSDDPCDVTQEAPETARAVAMQKTSADINKRKYANEKPRDDDGQDEFNKGEKHQHVESIWNKEQCARGNNDIANLLHSVDKKNGVRLSTIDENSTTLQKNVQLRNSLRTKNAGRWKGK